MSPLLASFSWITSADDALLRDHRADALGRLADRDHGVDLHRRGVDRRHRIVGGVGDVDLLAVGGERHPVCHRAHRLPAGHVDGRQVDMAFELEVGEVIHEHRVLRDARDPQRLVVGRNADAMRRRIEPMLDELESVMMTTEFLSTSPQIQQLFLDRWNQHSGFLQQRQHVLMSTKLL